MHPMHFSTTFWNATAAWVEAIGAIAAVIGSGWVAASDSRAARRREDRAAAAAVQKEVREALATRTAALNLAILAATHIHNLHVLLADEAWRGRVARISVSHGLSATERMLTAFPIQSLTEAAAMVEFSRFPASLATAAEIYANLEAAVRAAPEADRGAMFDASKDHMARLDKNTNRRLAAFATALGIDLASMTTMVDAEA